jgi:hypothetical protein
MIAVEIEEMNQEVAELENGRENQRDESEEGNEAEGVIEEPKQVEEEHELGFVVEDGMEEVEAGVEDQIHEEQRVLNSEERQIEDHRMKDREEFEIERRDRERESEEREQTDKDGRSIENGEGSAVGIVMDPADVEGDDGLDVSDFLV